jgi:hypothetical protein
MEKTNKSKCAKCVWVWIVIIVIILVTIACLHHHYKYGINGSNMSAISTGINTNQPGMMRYNLDGDSFVLAGTSTIVMSQMQTPPGKDPLPPMPASYTFAASSTGTVDAAGTNGMVVALYHGYGANIIVPAVFLFAANPTGTGPMIQVSATSTGYEDAKIHSVSVAQGIVTLNLLVVSQKDQQTLPHYEWQPNQPLSVQLKGSGGVLVPVSTK